MLTGNKNGQQMVRSKCKVLASRHTRDIMFYFMRKVKELPAQLDTQDICDWEWAKHGLSQSPTRQTHKSLKILIPDGLLHMLQCVSRG